MEIDTTMTSYCEVSVKGWVKSEGRIIFFFQPKGVWGGVCECPCACMQQGDQPQSTKAAGVFRESTGVREHTDSHGTSDEEHGHGHPSKYIG